MADEPFSAEYFQHLLNSLTLNSRALIVELTGLADKHLDSADVIVQLVEDRILKILPKYKLHTFYLMDSIVKSVGNPYNVLFAKNLYKIFTETYLVVTDTVTRQNLINLFKTWLTGKTNAGLDLFPHAVVRKIEQFVIKATSLGNMPNETVRITRDTLLREGNYLLQYIIAMDEDLDRFIAKNLLSDDNEEVKQYHRVRNNLVMEVNTISEAAMMENKLDFDAKKDAYATQLQIIRRTLDDQSFQQLALLRGIKEKQDAADKKHERELKIEVNSTPRGFDITMMLSEKDALFDTYVEEWGKPIVVEDESRVLSPEPKPEESSLASSLGLSVTSFNFLDSFLGSPKNELTPISEMSSLTEVHLDDGDGYDPEETLTDFDLHRSPSKPFNGKSSLKRAVENEERVVKKVRFDV